MRFNNLILLKNDLLDKIVTLKNISNLLFIFISEIFKFYIDNIFYKKILDLPLNRIDLVKAITYKLEKTNIIYLKLFQSLCLEKNLLYENEKEYLLKYTDNVPYINEEINYELLNTLESKYNILLETNDPINSGIIGIVFKGFDKNNNSNVIIKMLKMDIKQRLISVCNELKLLAYILSYIPYLKNFNLYDLLLDNEEILLNQINFVEEASNIEIFKSKNSNIEEFKIPSVYKEITNDLKNIIVMEDIKGLTFKDIENFSEDDKNEFGKLILKFGYISVLYNSAVHCDLHAGNIFFYKNDLNPDLPLYQIGLIDFGIVSYPSKESQNNFYNFFYNTEIIKNFDNIFDKLKYFIKPKGACRRINNLNELEEKLIYGLKKYAAKSEIVNFFNYLNKTLNAYNMSLTKEFNQIVLSLQIVGGLSNKLTKDIHIEQIKVFEDLTRVNKLLEFY
tara:strand:- start:1378 stop:2724 length:1347 start_codon:yes stop_codon:yes gene_type:complete